MMAFAGKTRRRLIGYPSLRMRPAEEQGARALSVSRGAARYAGRNPGAYGHPDAGAWISIWLWAALPLVAVARLLLR